jgi:hypothetical protein
MRELKTRVLPKTVQYDRRLEKNRKVYCLTRHQGCRNTPYLQFEKLRALVSSDAEIDRDNLIIIFILLGECGQYSGIASEVRQSIDLDGHVLIPGREEFYTAS